MPGYIQKAALVLRDDVEKLFSSLLGLYKEKLARLKQLHLSEADKRYFITVKDSDRLADSLKKDGTIIDEISVLDYSIASVKDRIRSIAGIHIDNGDRRIYPDDEAIVRDINAIIFSIQNILKGIISARESLVREMEAQMLSTEKDIAALSKMRLLKIIK